jgi:hypothetical protein
MLSSGGSVAFLWLIAAAEVRGESTRSPRTLVEPEVTGQRAGWLRVEGRAQDDEPVALRIVELLEVGGQSRRVEDAAGR